MKSNGWPRIAVMGAGAVGSYFGGMFARAGAPVVLIGRQAHVDAMSAGGLFIESVRFQEKVSVSASTSVEAIRGASIVLFSVKTTDTEEAAKAIAPNLEPDSIVVCMQNGVDGAERIRAAAGIDAIPAVVYVAAGLEAPGHVKHFGRGELIIGGEAPRERIERVAAISNRAGVPCRISPAIETDLWTKMVMNCAYNALSAVTQARYGRLVQDAGIREVMRLAIEETVAVARALGVQMPDGLVEAGWKLADSMPNQLSSTAQDLARGKRTEIESLNGYVARRGRELGVATPVNETLRALVKLLEGKIGLRPHFSQTAGGISSAEQS